MEMQGRRRSGVRQGRQGCACASVCCAVWARQGRALGSPSHSSLHLLYTSTDTKDPEYSSDSGGSCTPPSSQSVDSSRRCTSAALAVQGCENRSRWNHLCWAGRRRFASSWRWSCSCQSRSLKISCRRHPVLQGRCFLRLGRCCYCCFRSDLE